MDKTLLKGLKVLETVVSGPKSIRIIDVAQELDLTKSNAYRVLRTLEAAGYIKQDSEGKAFAPTLKLWELGNAAVGRLDLRARAAAALSILAAESRETVHLAVLDGKEVIYIEKIDSTEPIAAYTRLGGRAPAHCVATGKALLSAVDAADRQAVLGPVLSEHSPNSITSFERLEKELAQASSQGFAMNRGEWREGVWGIASAIIDSRGRPLAAVGISGPEERLSNASRREDLIAMVKSAAERIKAEIGGEHALPPGI